MFLSPQIFEISWNGKLEWLPALPETFPLTYLHGKFHQGFLNSQLNSSAQQPVGGLASGQMGGAEQNPRATRDRGTGGRERPVGLARQQGEGKGRPSQEGMLTHDGQMEEKLAQR